MYTLTRLISLRHLLLEQLPTLAVSLVIAETFYKFHSFTVECVAFLLTWYAVDGTFQFVRSRLSSNKG